MLEKPLLMVEKTEEAAATLHRDIIFYRGLIKRRDEVLYLPAHDGPSSSGQRAMAAHRLRECDECSLVTSDEAMDGHLWEPGALKNAVLEITKGAEIGRDTFATRLRRN
jgi:hypothetical protein